MEQYTNSQTTDTAKPVSPVSDTDKDIKQALQKIRALEERIADQAATIQKMQRDIQRLKSSLSSVATMRSTK